MKKFFIISLTLCATITMMAQTEKGRSSEGHLSSLKDGRVATELDKVKFCIAKDGKTATIVVDENDWKGVIRAAKDLGDDVRKVCGTPSEVIAHTSSILPLTSSIVVPSSVIKPASGNSSRRAFTISCSDPLSTYDT